MSKRLKIFFKLLFIRVRVCYNIMFMRHKHWFLVSVTDKELLEVFKDKNCTCLITYHRLDDYIVHEIIRRVYNSKDDIERILDKAAFQARADLYSNKK